MQMSMFDGTKPFYFEKPIRLIEFFAGYGSQHLALKELLEFMGVKVQHWKICEWAIKSIQAYKDLHFNSDKIDYSLSYPLDSIIKELHRLGISANYNEPMQLEQIKRLGEKQIRAIFNNIRVTHNLVNISQVKGADLEIINTDVYDYILTYSFPCQDLSKAGKQKGMAKDSGTRSGLLWEVERILDECCGGGDIAEDTVNGKCARCYRDKKYSTLCELVSQVRKSRLQMLLASIKCKRFWHTTKPRKMFYG